MCHIYEERLIDGQLIYRRGPDSKWEAVNSEKGLIIYSLLAITEEERMEVFSYFCKHCGGLSPCNCMRDE